MDDEYTRKLAKLAHKSAAKSHVNPEDLRVLEMSRIHTKSFVFSNRHHHGRSFIELSKSTHEDS